MCVRTLIALFLRTVMIMTVISNLNSQRGHLSWTARLTFLVDMVRMLLVTLLLDMIQQGSLHMYRGFCSGMFQVCSLLTIKIIHLNELVILIWHRKKHAEVSMGVFKAFTQNITSLDEEEVCMD